MQKPAPPVANQKSDWFWKTITIPFNIAGDLRKVRKAKCFLICQYLSVLLGYRMNNHWSGCRRLSEINWVRGGILLKQFSQPKNIDVIVVIKVTPPTVNIWPNTLTIFCFKMKLSYFAYLLWEDMNISNSAAILHAKEVLVWNPVQFVTTKWPPVLALMSASSRSVKNQVWNENKAIRLRFSPVHRNTLTC